jgi:hypothetical protein
VVGRREGHQEQLTDAPASPGQTSRHGRGTGSIAVGTAVWQTQRVMVTGEMVIGPPYIHKACSSRASDLCLCSVLRCRPDTLADSADGAAVTDHSPVS